MTKKEYETLAAFRYELRRFLHFSEQAAQKQALNVQQYQALLAIEGFPGRNWVTVGELAEKLQIAANSAVGLVNRLQKAGLIERCASQEDRRRVIVRLSATGRTVFRKLAAVHRKEMRTFGPLLAGLLARLEEAGK